MKYVFLLLPLLFLMSCEPVSGDANSERVERGFDYRNARTLVYETHKTPSKSSSFTLIEEVYHKEHEYLLTRYREGNAGGAALLHSESCGHHSHTK